MNLGCLSFDWLFGNARTSLTGNDLYGPQDGQFMVFGQYPYSRSRGRVNSVYEDNRSRKISEEERKSRIEGLARVAQSNYEQQLYIETMYKSGRRRYFRNKNKIYP